MKKIIVLLLSLGFTVMIGLPGHCSSVESVKPKIEKVNFVYQVCEVAAAPVLALVPAPAALPTYLAVPATELNLLEKFYVPEIER